MVIQIKKWGNSASVRIPASVMAAANLKLDQAVDVKLEDGRIVISPVTVQACDLDAMLEEMQPSTFHDDVDFGRPVGKEKW